jgi:hypothetical protein
VRHDRCGTVLWIFEDMMGAADADQPPTFAFETADDGAAVGEHCGRFHNLRLLIDYANFGLATAASPVVNGRLTTNVA